MLLVWSAEDRATVILVGPHNGSSNDVYAALNDALQLDVSEAERRKPPCCDDEGHPPVDEGSAQDVADAIRQAARNLRRRAQ